MIVNTSFSVFYLKLSKIYENHHNFDLKIFEFIQKVIYHLFLHSSYIQSLDSLLHLSVSNKQNHAILFASF